jgi:hypothetical protein
MSRKRLVMAREERENGVAIHGQLQGSGLYYR